MLQECQFASASTKMVISPFLPKAYRLWRDPGMGEAGERSGFGGSVGSSAGRRAGVGLRSKRRTGGRRAGGAVRWRACAGKPLPERLRPSRPCAPRLLQGTAAGPPIARRPYAAAGGREARLPGHGGRAGGWPAGRPGGKAGEQLAGRASGERAGGQGRWGRLRLADLSGSGVALGPFTARRPAACGPPGICS